MKLKVIIEREGEEFFANLEPEYKHLGFYGQGYSPDEAEDDFMMSYDEYKMEEISEGKEPQEYDFNFIICE